MGPVYNYTCYKAYANERIRSLKNNGRGTYSKIAKYLGVSNVLVSQVLNGDRNFVRDKVFSLGQFFGLNVLELEYYMSLYEENVAISDDHKQFLQTRLVKIKSEIVETEMDRKDEVSKEYQKIYYSSWLYAAARISLLKDNVSTAKDVANFLGYPVATILPIIEFLEQAGLVVKEMDDRYRVTERYVHVTKDSEHVMNHHMNLKNLEINRIIDGVDEDEVCYSSLVVTSRKVIEDQMEKMKKAIIESAREFSKGESEDLILFNMSLLNISKNGTKAQQLA